MDKIKKSLVSSSRAKSQDKKGFILVFSSILVVMVVVFSIFLMITMRGLNTFFVNKINIFNFLFHNQWNPESFDKSGNPMVGAFPMILGSFSVTLISGLIATPFALASAVFMTELSGKLGKKIMYPIIELLVGIPSVIYGFVGLITIVPFIRNHFGGTGFGILSGSLVLAVMVLPTIISMYVDSLNGVPRSYREASLSLGATRWQTIYKVVIRSSIPGLLTAIIFGMARAFGEALAVQMVIGNETIIPHNLTTAASTLTSVLTMGMGNTIMGTLPNNALWSLALVLLLMSLVFNLLIRYIGNKKVIK